MSKNGGNKTTAFILGAAIGTVAALMLAPFSGKKMRRVTKEKGKKALDEAKTRYTNFEKNTLKPGLLKAKLKGQEVIGKTAEVRDRAVELKDDAVEKVTELKNNAVDKAEELKDNAKDKVISLKSRFSKKTENE